MQPVLIMIVVTVLFAGYDMFLLHIQHVSITVAFIDTMLLLTYNEILYNFNSNFFFFLNGYCYN